MRLARIKAGQLEGAVYHCISRTVGGQKLLDDACKERMASLLISLAGFCGLEVITYCMMGNHFHLLVRVPKAMPLNDEELLRRAEGFAGPDGRLGAPGGEDRHHPLQRGTGPFRRQGPLAGPGARGSRR